MKYISYILLTLLFVTSLASCSSDDEPKGYSFKLISEDTEDVVISDDGKSAFINTISYETTYTFTISGDFANIVFDSSAEWLSASCTNKIIIVHIDKYSGDEDFRSGRIDFTIFNDSQSASGHISVKQKDERLSYEDLRNIEQDAINFFLQDKKCVKTPPTSREDNNFEAGENAPWYYIDNAPIVAMKVLSRGNGESIGTGSRSNDNSPKDGDKVYFRFERYNLMDYYKSGGESMNSEISFNTLSSTCSFFLNDTETTVSKQWGIGIQVPMLYGLEYGSEVMIVIGSVAGPQAEVANVTPYLYRVTYFRGEDSEQNQFPPSQVYLSFFDQATWNIYGVTEPLSYKFFNKSKQLPSNFTFEENFATGLGGLLVVCDVNSTIKAYDAACPVEHDANVTITIGDDYKAHCAKCGSTFDVFELNGVPLSGKALESMLGLKSYRVNRYADIPYLYITN